MRIIAKIVSLALAAPLSSPVNIKLMSVRPDDQQSALARNLRQRSRRRSCRSGKAHQR